MMMLTAAFDTLREESFVGAGVPVSGNGSGVQISPVLRNRPLYLSSPRPQTGLLNLFVEENKQ